MALHENFCQPTISVGIGAWRSDLLICTTRSSGDQELGAPKSLCRCSTSVTWLVAMC